MNFEEFSKHVIGPDGKTIEFNSVQLDFIRFIDWMNSNGYNYAMSRTNSLHTFQVLYDKYRREQSVNRIAAATGFTKFDNCVAAAGTSPDRCATEGMSVQDNCETPVEPSLFFS